MNMSNAAGMRIPGLVALDWRHAGWLGSLLLHGAAVLCLAVQLPIPATPEAARIMVSLTPSTTPARTREASPARRESERQAAPVPLQQPLQHTEPLRRESSTPVPAQPVASSAPVLAAAAAPAGMPLAPVATGREAGTTTQSAPAGVAAAAPPASTALRGAAEVPASAPVYDAAYLNNPAPAYPAPSRRLREQGQVVLRVLVNSEGRAEQVEVRNGSGFARLDDSAREAVTRWRFVPARRGEQPVPAWVLVPLTFRLNA